MRSPVNETATISEMFGWEEESVVGSRRPIIKRNVELFEEEPEKVWLINVIWKLPGRVRGCFGEIILSGSVRQGRSGPHTISNEDKKEESRVCSDF